MKKIHRISKSQYLRGVQCPKALWLYRHRPELAAEVTEARQYIFDTGNEVGELAKRYFEGGVEIEENYYQIDQAIKSTDRAVQRGNGVIFEATASSEDGAFSRIDVFKKTEGMEAWDLIEVKSATEVKDYYIDDIALQRYAFTGAGYSIRKSILMHLNSDYVRFGELDLKSLFRLDDCTDTVAEYMPTIGPRVKELIKLLSSGDEPEVDIGDQCTDPFECDYIPYCWQHVPEYSVYDIFSGARLHDLLSAEIMDVADVPDGFDMTDRQSIAVSAYKKNKTHKDTLNIRAFLDRLQYPLYFLDYESVWPAVPLFDRSTPYQQIPFQYSLHVQPRKGGALKHIEFLHTGADDPRPGLVRSLIENCGNQGSVVVYNQAYESRINNELGRDFPEHRSALEKINSRMADLLVPFRSRHLYHPEMKGSASLKSVLPAFAPEMSYEGLAIADGEAASIRYLSCIRGLVTGDEKQKIFDDLKTYCRQDTRAEVTLLEMLYRHG